MSEESRALAFRLLDKDDDRALDQKEFLEVSAVLMLRVPKMRESHACLSWSWPLARRFVESPAFEILSSLLIVLYIVLLILMAADLGVEPAAMQKVLEKHVRAQLDDLAEVKPDLR